MYNGVIYIIIGIGWVAYGSTLVVMGIETPVAEFVGISHWGFSNYISVHSEI